MFFMFGFYLYLYIMGGVLIEDQRINPTTGEVYSVGTIIAVG